MSKMQLVGPSLRRRLLQLGFLGYLFLLLKVVLFKTHGSRILLEAMSAERLQFRLRYVANFVPLKTIMNYLDGTNAFRVVLENLAGNIVIFVPMGFAVPLLFPKVKRAWHTAGIALLSSLALEVVQLVTGLGSFDVDDLLLNVAGAMLGWLVYRIVRP